METTPSKSRTKQNAATLPPRRGRVKVQIFQSIAGKLSSAVSKDYQAMAKTKWGSSVAAASLPPLRGSVKALIFSERCRKPSSAVTKDCQAMTKTKWGSSSASASTSAVYVSTSSSAAGSLQRRRGHVKAQNFESIPGKLSSAVKKACKVLAKTKGCCSSAAVSNISTSTSAAEGSQFRRLT